MRHLRLFPAVRERCGAGCRCGRSALRRKGRERTAPRRQARQGGRGRKQSPPSRIESSHYSSFPSPPPSRKQAAVRDGRPFAGFRCGQVSPCLARISGPPQHRSSVSSTATASGRLHLGFFTLSPAAGNKLGEQRGGGEAPPAPKARRHGAPDGGGLHGPKGPQRREGEDVIVGHISISLPTETGCVSGAAERRAERDSKRAERKIALHRTDFCVPPQGAEAADRRRRRDRPESRAGALRRSGAAPNGRHRRRGDIGLPGKRPDGEQRLRRNRMRSAFRTQCAEERKTSETRRTLPEKAGASSDLARDAPGQKGYREAQNVSGDTGRDPRLARNAPRNGNIRNTPNASGEGGRVFGPRTRCAGTKRLPGSAERIRRYRMRPAFRTQCAEKRKHPKRDEGLRRRRAPKRTQQGRRRDGKPDVFSPSEKSVPRRRHLFFSGKIPIFVRYLIRTNE